MRRSNSCLPPGRSFHGCSTIKNLAKEVARDAVAAARHSFLRRNGLPECALQDSLLVVRIARSIFLSSSFSGAVHFVRLRTKKWSLAQCCCCRCRLLVGTVGLPVLGVRTRRTCRDATGGQRNRAVNFSAIGSCARVSILPPPPILTLRFFIRRFILLVFSATTLISPQDLTRSLPRERVYSRVQQGSSGLRVSCWGSSSYSTSTPTFQLQLANVCP